MQLTRGQYAALRAWIQGLPITLIASRYLGHLIEENSGEFFEEAPAPDDRLIKRELADIRTTLIQRAHQHAMPALAKALTSDFHSSEFAEKKALQAVHDLERFGEPYPAIGHTVESWFAPALAKRLRRADIATIEDLFKFSNDYGRAFWRRIPRIGIKAASAIIQWCRTYEDTLGVVLGAHVTGAHLRLDMPVNMAPTEIHPGTRAVPPLEAIRIPPWCDGRDGSNRADLGHSALTAQTDYDALLTFLSLRPKKSPTWRAYRKECERFLAWTIIERGKSFSDLKTEDCIAYREFLKNPQPAARWCGPMVSRTLPGWRPFQGALAASSRKYALTVLRHFCEWLVRKQYWRVNPWLDVPADTHEPRIQIEKALPIELWNLFCEWLQKKAADPADSRIRTGCAAIILLRDSGMRLSEACHADRAAITHLIDNNDVWGELQVFGKRNKERHVTLSHRAIDALRAHWIDRGEDFDAADAGPLLAVIEMPKTQRGKEKRERGELGYTVSGLHRVVSTAAARFAAELQKTNPSLAERAKKTRAHALRHTFGTHAAEENVPIDVLQNLLGHVSMNTTTIYTQPGKKRRLREIGKLYRASK